MWFLGAFFGGLAGASAGGFAGFCLGALAGGFAGAAFVRNGRIAALEQRVAGLEKTIERAMAPAAQPAAPATTPVKVPEAQPEPEPQYTSTPTLAQVEPGHEAPPLTAHGRPAVEAPPAAAEVPPAVPSGPQWWEKLLGGNLVVKIGILVLFCGVAFLMKYTYDRIHVPIELRLTGAALGAIVLLAIGWRLRHTRTGYALVMQGGGVALLYLVIFAAFRMFHVLPAAPAFFMLVVVAVTSALLSILQNSLALATIGVAGGFLAPILASTGQGSHVMLFSYYAVLNAGIVAIAWVKAWRVLNLLGFGFTFAIGWLWGEKAYRPEYFATTEPFLLLFLAMYLAIPILFARRRAVELKDYVDGTLVFGVPIAAFGLQTALVRGMEYGAAYSALGLALIYLVLATAMFRRTGSGLRMLVESYIALCLAFGTLAIPLAFEGRLTSAAWALEGAAVVWIAMRQGRLLARAFGYLLQFGAGVAFLWDVGHGYGATPVLNSFYLGSVLLAIAAFFCGAYIHRRPERLHPQEGALSTVFLLWGALWWYGGGVHEIVRHVDWAYRTQAVLMFFAASSVAFSLIAAACRWPRMRWLWLLLYAAMAMQLGLELARGAVPFAHLGLPAWGLAFAAHFWLLARHADDHRPLAQGLHPVGLWVLAILGAREVGWLIDRAVEGKRVWPAISWVIVPAALLAALCSRWLQARWPVAAFTRAYLVVGGTPLAVFLALWVLYANFTSNGDPYPLPFVPLLNPLDIAIGLAFLIVAWWLRGAAQHGLGPWLDSMRDPLIVLFGAWAFVWVNGILLRSLHHWGGVPFALEPMLSSRLVQAALCILWMLLALGAMVAATRRALRALWIVGACLMGVVVGKLFLVDLSGVGTIERIVSFIGVGALMLLVGYLSPVPPSQEARAS
jgi:uncharacterized membrane protein